MPRFYSSRRRVRSNYTAPRRRTLASRRNYSMMARKRNYLRRVNQRKPIEVNYIDLASASYGCNTTGSLTLIATIAQGAAQTQRIGRKIRFKSIQVRGFVSSDTTTAFTTASWFLVYDKRPTGTLPAITDVLDSASANSLTNTQNVGRFQIIKRKNYSLCGNTGTAGQQTAKTAYYVDEFIKFSKASVFKAAGTGAIGDIEQGALYLVTVGSTAAGTSDAIANLTFRTRFWDV